MKKTSLILMLLVVAPSLVAGQTLRRETNSVGKRKQQVMKLDGEWNDAVQRRDLKTLEYLMAEDYVSTGSHGEVRNKAQELIDLKAAAPDFLSFDTDEVNVRLHGTAAIVTGRMRLAVLYKNQEVGGQFRYTRVYIRRLRRWVLAASHTSKEQIKEAFDEGAIP